MTDRLRDRHDVVAVGGGAAGLSGALMLARARRSVVVIDACAPRNAPAASVHGCLSQDGIRPVELLERGRAEVRRYGGHVVPGEVGAVARDDNGFTVTLADSRSADVTLFSHTVPPPIDEEAAQLAARGIGVVDGEVASLEIVNDRLTGVRLRECTVVARQALAVSPRMPVRAGFLAALGLRPTEHPRGMANTSPPTPTGRTDVPGVWAAGNVTDPAAKSAPPQPRARPRPPRSTPTWSPKKPAVRSPPGARRVPRPSHPEWPEAAIRVAGRDDPLVWGRSEGQIRVVAPHRVVRGLR